MQTYPNATTNIPKNSAQIQILNNKTTFFKKNTFTINNNNPTNPTKITFKFNNLNTTQTIKTTHIHIPYQPNYSTAQITTTIRETINRIAALNISTKTINNIITITTNNSTTLNTNFTNINTLNNNITSTTNIQNNLPSKPNYYTIHLLQPNKHFNKTNFNNYQKPHIKINNTMIIKNNSKKTTIKIKIHIKHSLNSTI